MTDPQKVTIVSDGTAIGTRILVGDSAIKHVTRIEFEPLEIDGLVRAKIHLDMVALRMKIACAEIECDDPEAKSAIQRMLDDMVTKTGN